MEVEEIRARVHSFVRKEVADQMGVTVLEVGDDTTAHNSQAILGLSWAEFNLPPTNVVVRPFTVDQLVNIICEIIRRQEEQAAESQLTLFQI